MRAKGLPATVEVLPAGAGPARPQRPRLPPDPFDVFRNPGFPSFPGFGLDEPDPSQADVVPPFPDELKVERARTPWRSCACARLRSASWSDSRSLWRVDAYGSRGPFREVSSNEPSHSRFPFVRDHHRCPRGEAVSRPDRRHQLLRGEDPRVCAVSAPLREPADRPDGNRLRRPRLRFARTDQRAAAPSEALEVSVVEPPIAGRPPGYKIGDVGRFTLSANVEPREVMAGSAVSVVVKLEGTGNLPHQLNVPEQRGVEWLEPAIVDDVEPQGGVVGGWRKFSYVVRLDRAGNVELGEIALPYWDPQRGAYEVARATLGAIGVRDNPKLAKPSEKPADTPEIALPARKTLGPVGEGPRYLGDLGWFWLALAAGPLGVIGLRGATRLGGSLRSRWQARRQAHQTRANLALREAQAALERNEAAQAASAVERAVHLAIEAKAELRARGVLRDELAATLEARGISSDSAKEAVLLLDACDALRFTSSETIPPRALVDRASQLFPPPSLRGQARRRERRMKRRALCFGAWTAFALWAAPAAAASGTPEQAFKDAATAIERGAYDEAIDRFELLADQGFSHPDASFDRAVAYLARAQSPRARTGDFGRAVAALAETLLLRPSDTEAEAALERVESEIARRRAREGRDQITARPSLARAVTGLAPENVWAVLAGLGALLLSGGLAIRWWSGRATWRLGATIALSIGGVLLFTFGGLAAAARRFRKISDPAVVVVQEARLLDESGKALSKRDGAIEHEAIPEGGMVEVHERRGQLLAVEWGTTRAWVSAGQIVVLHGAGE